MLWFFSFVPLFFCLFVHSLKGGFRQYFEFFMLFSAVSQGANQADWTPLNLLADHLEAICRIDLWGICRNDLWKLSTPLILYFSTQNSSRCQTRPFQRQGYGTHIQIQPSGAINMERRSMQGELFLREYTHAWLFMKWLQYREKNRETLAHGLYTLSPHI